MQGQRIGYRAVVLGAGMAGLLAARALADRYAEVVLVDRDDPPADPAPRRGVPQGRHIHALLAGGQQALEQLLPGLTDELVVAGAARGDLLADTRMYLSGHRLRSVRSGLAFVSVSRPLLEDRVRRRVLARPEVRMVGSCDAVGLVTSADARHVTGARVLRRADGSAPQVLDAALVVDATGRGSRAADWLAGLGHARPPEERVPVDVGYATRTYRLPPDVLDGALGVLLGLSPDHPRGGALARIEGDRWMVSLIGVRGEHPPTDPAGFAAFAASLGFPDITRALEAGEPLDEPVAHRFPANVRRRYDRLRTLPAHFLVLGDAVCCLDPAYGQGMSIAALEAVALRRHLEHRSRVAPRAWYRQVARITAPVWDVTAGADRTFAQVDAAPSRRTRLLAAYVARLHAAAAHDPVLATTVARVSGLVATPTAVVRPPVVARVVRHAVTRNGAGTNHKPQVEVDEVGGGARDVGEIVASRPSRGRPDPRGLAQLRRRAGL